MYTRRIRLWAVMLMLTACCFVYASAMSSLPAAGTGMPAMPWLL